MTDRVRTAHPEYDPHLGLGNRRVDSSYHPKFTHEQLDAIIDELLRGGREEEDGTEVVVFGSKTDPVTTDVSGPFVPRYDHSELDVLIVRDGGTTAMTVTLYQNGASVGTVSTTASGLVATDTLDVDFEADTDILTIAATTVGTGTGKATVQVTLR